MLVSDTLNKAADLIQERGWGQGSTTWRGDGKLCLEGGIAAVVGIDAIDRHRFMQCPAYKAVEAYLGKRAVDGIFDGTSDLYRWNDQDGRTAEEVIEVLRAAALIEQAKENSSIETNETVAA